ncbi:Lysophosphatidylcholine acyltransferase 3 [Gonapodya sp. JEL0774]|nr:Lysophosphatidylcholine acyltransferase 3 [Gonapodya sp. JEL0774]
MYPIEELSAATGVPTGNLALLSYLLLAYPIALFYRILFLSSPSSASPTVRNLFVVVSGLLAAYWFHQGDWTEFFHPFATTLGSWLILKAGEVTGIPRSVGSTAVWFFNVGYLGVGYYYCASDVYYINWLMPQCVLCLRLIGFAMDFSDGSVRTKEGAKRKPSASIISEEDHPLEKLPSLLNTFGYAYYFGGWLVGPQFPYARYSRWLDGTLYSAPADSTKTNGDAKASKSLPAGSWLYALRSLFLGLAYLAFCQVVGGYFPTLFLTTKEFAEFPLGKRFAYSWAAGKFALEKYLGIWILTEGPNAISGLSFDGVDSKTGRADWSGLRNIDTLKYEFPWSLQNIVESFNINTNNWSKIYVYKRLRFLGNKDLSGISTLLFLAAWHGFHVGYFATFALEFMDMDVEKRLKRRFGDGIYQYLSTSTSAVSRLLFFFYRLLCFVLTTSVLYFGAISFDLLQLKYIIPALSALYWWSPVVNTALIVLDILLAAVGVRFPTEKKKVPKVVENGTANGKEKSS